ncbi:MAG: flagellar hook-length control protein FliK [Deltaproteobacteria bacterium]|jgi:hypothetical protein|nr:flagellar hook-length control protein FliK [Deltaproteobacteria bacterium]
MESLAAMGSTRVELSPSLADSYVLDGNFEENASDDFARALARAESERENYTKEAERQAARRADEARVEAGRRSRKEKAVSEEGQETQETQEDLGLVLENSVTLSQTNSEENAFKFKAKRSIGALAFAMVQTETNLPGAFKAKVSRELLLTNNQLTGAQGVLMGQKSALGLLTDALNGADTNLELFSLTLDSESLSSLENLLLSSGLETEKINEILGSLLDSGPQIALKDLIKTLQGADTGEALLGGGMVATEDGLNNLGQFLLGLGMSLETVKGLTTGIEPGAALTASTLRDFLTQAADSSGLDTLLGEGDLNFLALALESMGAGTKTINGINMLMDANNGNVTLGDLLNLLSSMEKPVTQSPNQVALDIQTLISKIKTEAELVKAPVFNEIIMKLSLLGDRELDKNFYELSPALQALRGGISGAKEGVNTGGGEYPGHGGKEDRREREERRLAATSLNAVEATSKGQAGAFSSSLYDEVAQSSYRDAIAKQIRDKLVYSSRRGIRRIKMSLSPEELGDLDIELKVKGSLLTANIKTQSMEAYKALEAEMEDLRSSLAKEGIELKLTITYEGSGAIVAEGALGSDVDSKSAKANGQNGEDLEENFSFSENDSSNHELLNAVV